MELYGKDKIMLSKQIKLRGLEISRSPNRRPKSSSTSQNNNNAIISYPSHPKNIKTENFPTPIRENYSVGKIIGDGNFAVVRKCVHLKTNETYALKIIDKSKGNGRDAPPEYEVKILSMVKHPNVIKMIEQFDFNNELYIVLELIEVSTFAYTISTLIVTL
jgi:doublecortin-like kinase 1/2